MTQVERDRYVFHHQSILEIRSLLGLKQMAMAEELGVPANTLSRWETGVTTPDAASLAKLYSIAVERGITPEFFRRRRPRAKKGKSRDRVLVFWDFQNAGVTKNQLAAVASGVKQKLEARFGAASYRRYKAFGSAQQASATDELANLGWRVFEDDRDIDKELISQAKSDAGQEPIETTLVLIANDRDYASFVNELKGQGVDIYLGTRSANPSEKLVEAIGASRLIKF